MIFQYLFINNDREKTLFKNNDYKIMNTEISRTIASLTSSSNLDSIISTSCMKDIKEHNGEIFFISPTSSKEKNDRSIEVFHGVNWYDYLVLHEDVMSLMDQFNYDTLRKMFIVCCALPWKDNKVRRKFAAFANIDCFLKHIVLFPVNQWYFFEVILGESAQKLYFDIDIQKDKLPKDTVLEDFSRELLNSLIQSIVLCMTDYDILVDIQKDLLIFSSNASHKHSFHVILNNYYVDNNKCNIVLCNSVKEKILPQFCNYIDEKVYSSKQQLRMYKSQKAGTGRIKELMKSYYYDGKEILSIQDTFENTFKSSCITYIPNCRAIPVRAPITIDKNLMYQNNSINLTNDDIEEIKKMLHPDILTIYGINPIKDRFITLQRKRRGFCRVCEREHDHENAYINVTQNWDVYLNCRRQNDGKSLYIGQLINNSEAKKLGLQQQKLFSITSCGGITYNNRNRNKIPDNVFNELLNDNTKKTKLSDNDFNKLLNDNDDDNVKTKTYTININDLLNDM